MLKMFTKVKRSSLFPLKSSHSKEVVWYTILHSNGMP
jgi:hypothetical protein